MGENAFEGDIILVRQYAIVLVHLTAKVTDRLPAKHAGINGNIVGNLNIVEVIVDIVLAFRIQEYFVIFSFQVIFFQLLVPDRVFY